MVVRFPRIIISLIIALFVISTLLWWASFDSLSSDADWLTRTTSLNDVRPVMSEEDDVHAIYNSIVRAQKTRFITINDQTKGDSMGGPPPEEMQKYPRELTEDYGLKNKSTAKIENRFGPEYRMLSDELKERSPNTKDRRDYNKITKQPNDGLMMEGVLTLSAIGFDSDHSMALVSDNYTCGLCGHGYFYILKKTGSSEWVIQRKIQMWVS